MCPSTGIRSLHQLAHLYGVQTAYYDVAHHRRPASPESLLAILKTLGAPVETVGDTTSALRERSRGIWQRPLEPVIVAWHGEPVIIEVRLPVAIADTTLFGQLTLENSEQRTYQWSPADSRVTTTAEVEGVHYVVKRLLLPDVLPLGYHRFTLQVMGISAETFIIAAPVRAYSPRQSSEARKWGVFIPLYATGNKNTWASGSYSDLESLTEWISGLGGEVIATLPLLATFLNEPFEPSPYAPISRLFWNEFYLDLARVPEFTICPSAQAILNSPEFMKETDLLRSSGYVEYQREMTLKRRILEELCQNLFTGDSNRRSALESFIHKNPLVEEYARFRATMDKKHSSWHDWPQRLRDGVLKEGDYDEKDRRYHLYAQWLVHQQVESLHQKASEKGVALYLDLPLGVHPDGYDAWRERETFILDASAGAPPDAVFTRGQDWALPPLHPDKTRELGYRYPIAYLRHHLKYAGILRIDHVMGLHRLYCIPKGLPADQGVYLRYHPEEFYAILALESYRHRSIIVGEDLGTVPREVRPAMTRHNFHRMYIMHYELESNPRQPLRAVSGNYVVSLNNHDMPTFAAFWQGLDIKQRLELGYIDKASFRKEQTSRQQVKQALIAFLQKKGWLDESTTDSYAVMRACLAFLSATQAGTALINLEDLWLEQQPQNVPSSGDKYPNWRRKAQYSLDEFCQLPSVLDILQEINKIRKPDTDSHG